MTVKKPTFLSQSTSAIIALGIISSAIILFQAGLALTAIILAIFILLASLGVAWLVYSNQTALAHEIQQTKNSLVEQQIENDEKFSKLTDLCQAILPLWQGQIDDVIAQSTQAINALSMRFSEIVQALRDTLQDVESLDSGNADANGNISDVLTHSEAQLSSLNSNFQLILSSKVELLGEVTQLQSFTNELQTMAIDVQGIAGQTNLLALNAAIEAA